MHYYEFNIGDYRRDTAHLSPIEHYIYRSLIDWYFLDEKPITQNNPTVLRRLNLGSDPQAEGYLKAVLEDFFEETEDGWRHKRIEAMLAEYRAKAEANRENGKKGGRPAKKQSEKTQTKPKETQPVILANPTESESNPNQRTINHKPITNLSLCASEEKTESPEVLPTSPPPEIAAGWPDLKILNDKLRVAGYQPVTPRQLEITLVKFDLHFDETILMSENRRLGKLVDWIGDKQRKRKDAWAAPESEKKPNPGNVDALWDRGEHQPPTDEQLAAFEQRKRQWAARDAALLAGVNHV